MPKPLCRISVPKAAWRRQRAEGSTSKAAWAEANRAQGGPIPCRRALPLLTEGSQGILSVTEGAAMSKPNDLVQGTLDLLILKMLAFEPMNGWAVGQRLKQLSSEVLQVSDGSLYPALHKLEQEGWVTSEWRRSENNRRAKFYSLTRAGRRQLQVESGNWERLAAAISALVRLQEA